jgi:CheY-like chemotaxis protein
MIEPTDRCTGNAFSGIITNWNPIAFRGIEKTVPKHDAESETLPALSPSILLVEDDPNLRLAMSAALGKHGFLVMSASDGLIAIEKFRASPCGFDVVLLDMTLPGKSGLEVLREMRQINPDARIVLTSAYDVDVRDLSVEGNLSISFIRKPYRLKELVESLFRELALGSVSVKQ